MDFVYLLLHESGSDWEDMVIILTEEDAIKESINHPNHRVEIFSKNSTTGYKPTYNYYKNGELIHKK
jgi:hypothetical protein|uniref:Uncharacterized protein n=1 Tax=viral metagenome TaxID=1070528 RepID=A0A6C0LR68_9ZZZZ